MYTHIILLVDRSGSMESIKYDMEGGIRTFIQEQKLVEGKCTVTFCQFDHDYEKIYSLKDIQDFPYPIITPRGSTALIDAMCKLIDDSGRELAEMKPEDRPEKVMFVVITDGQENSSIKFTSEELKQRVQHQESKYNWSFVYLGANQNAFNVASNYGITASSAGNFTATSAGVSNMFASLSNSATKYRVSNTASKVIITSTPEEEETTKKN